MSDLTIFWLITAVSTNLFLLFVAYIVGNWYGYKEGRKDEQLLSRRYQLQTQVISQRELLTIIEALEQTKEIVNTMQPKAAGELTEQPHYTLLKWDVCHTAIATDLALTVCERARLEYSLPRRIRSESS